MLYTLTGKLMGVLTEAERCLEVGPVNPDLNSDLNAGPAHGALSGLHGDGLCAVQTLNPIGFRCAHLGCPPSPRVIAWLDTLCTKARYRTLDPDWSPPRSWAGWMYCAQRRGMAHGWVPIYPIYCRGRACSMPEGAPPLHRSSITRAVASLHQWR